jgi:diguanylate cyclase (GGDEF)-like protein
MTRPSEQQRQLLLENSRRDGLTKLYTRGAFFEMAEKLLAGRNNPYSVLMIDLDNFKNINDTYGHVAGDAVIRQAACLILQSIRDGDIAGRYGGEELCVLLPKCGSHAARIIAERIVSGAAKQVIYLSDGQSIKYTTSLGFSTYKPSEDSISKPPKLEDLLSSADAALYNAKKLGRNQVQAAQ